MGSYELELTTEDIGEIIEIIRVQHIKMHTKPFADKIGITERLLLMTEDGKGPHAFSVLKKVKTFFPNIKVTINVQVK
jgi:hypothetical protein